MLVLLFILFGGLAIGCAVNVVAQRNPLYCAISLIGVFVSLACLYLMLAAPFIAAVQIIVYAGAIMVLVVFVIMLLNVEQEEKRNIRLGFLVPVAVVLAAALIGEVAFILWSVDPNPTLQPSDIGLTKSIGDALFTTYLLPFEITSILLLMAIVGAMTLARRTGMLSPGARVIPGAQLLAVSDIDPSASHDDQTPISSATSDEAAQILGVVKRDQSKRD
ncbi:MAG TPA: NADH-quinone oxidoreductase subunit J [Pyrinomonadaceae bacterium]|jgi:NADH-quinone oxidoreductase subunit J|nr:NADH-quinone oxidoreductase subunit J [Pyrinomonadaceae bacterium]